MRINFQQKLIFSFVVIFILFTAGIVVFEQRRAKRYKTEALQEKLDAYADAVSRCIVAHGEGAPLDSLLSLMPGNLRVTLVDRDGNVMFDNMITDKAVLGNHAARPEIADAVRTGRGTFIRTSVSNSVPYLYYAKDNGNGDIVRVALPYDIDVRSFLKPDNAFLYFVIALFVAGLGLIYYIGRHFGRSVRDLRDFSLALNGDTADVKMPEFSDDEFGQISRQLAGDFERLREGERQLEREREKLLLHIQTSAEGICFFNPDRTVAFYNGLFMQYLNIVSMENISVGSPIPDGSPFDKVAAFLDTRTAHDDYFETQVMANGKEFFIRLNVFEDSSFEIILTDVTAREKTRRLKQEMTGNVAHELRTPVTSIRGFLEIMLNNDLGPEKTREYLERAYRQTKTLSELIADMSLLTKIDGKTDAIAFEDVELDKVLESVQADTASVLSPKGITFVSELPAGIVLRGNGNLVYSIFRNLTDNVATHAGDGVRIVAKLLGIEDGFARFSFADNGRGIEDEQHLARLFERFYRVGEGRTRETGGSGLGLSIVKNAVRLHGGNILVRNAEPHGLEFVFTLPVGR